MKKIELPLTWGYEDFITDEEQKNLIEFSFSIRNKLRPNGPGRFYHDKLTTHFKVPDCYKSVKSRIIEVENLKDYILDPVFGDFLSFNETEAAIHKHKDHNEDGYIHTRYNLLLSLPEKGGNPVYDDNIISVKEKMLWRCEAGKYNHASTPVIGEKPRINISFGFQIKDYN